LRDALLVLDENYRVVSFNAAAEGVLRRSGRELLGTPLPRLIPGVASVPRGERVELSLHVGDGERLPVEVALAAPRGEDRKFVALVSDLSDRRREQAERAEALLRFNEIAAHLEDAFYVASASTGKSLYASPAFARIYGRPLVAHEHTLWPRLEWVHFEDRLLVSDAAEAARDGAPYDLEYRIVTASGDVRTIRDRAHVSPERDRITGVVRDVTRERELTEELRQSQRLEAMGTLASSVAHDFNNILMGIGGCVQLAQRRLEPADPASAYLSRAADGMLRGAKLAKQILRIGDTRRLSDGQIVLDDVVFGARDLVESLLGPGIALSIVGQAPEVRVNGEAGDIEQILVTLATNARDAMPAGGAVVLSTELEGEEVILSVGDTGAGMSAAVKARVFEPFFTTKRGGKGTGLGLATVAALARRLGGRVGLESTQGAGTTVSVALPIAKRCSQLPPASSRPPRTGGETVLLVDDDPLVRLTVENYLEALGYRALSAADADEAIGFCEDPSLSIDLMISDVMMPGMLGGELGRELGRRNKAFGVIYMSAHPRDELVREGQLEAESVLLSKPFDANALSEAIATALEQKRHLPFGHGRRTLVIDDDAEIASTLGELLELEQFEVRVAFDAESALALAREFRPQIVVCDVELGPGMSGYELGVALRRTPGLAETYFIALSGRTLADIRERALGAGFVRVLGKPLELETLRRVLADAGA
jgi:signal transduction histidine kinase/DNA-binding response OmpR family regulator